MADLTYTDIIANDSKYQALADLSLSMKRLPTERVMTTLIDLLPDEILPVLAEKWSVTGSDGLLLADSGQSKRGLIRRSVELHRHKGTAWAVREVMRQLGFGEIEIDEGLKARTYENTVVQAINADDRWAYYAIRPNNAITNEQALAIRKTIASFVPARCTLATLDYKAVPIRYNNKVRYDGSYNHGST